MSEATKEKKALSKTETYKTHLQRIIYQELGVKVSRDKAWTLFKSIMHGTVEHVTELAKNDQSLPLSGVGTFEVKKAGPRGSKAGLDKDGKPIEGAVPWPFVPRMRWFPSSSIDKQLEQEFGLAEHGITPKHYGLYRDENDVAVDSNDEGISEEEVKEEANVEAPNTEESVDEFFDDEEI